MKSLLGRLGVILVVIGFTTFSYAEVWGADWKFLDGDDERSLFIDSESIGRLSSGTLRIWTKWIYTPKGISITISKLGKKYENFSYEIALDEFNCGDKTLRCLQITSYTKDGKIIENVVNPGKWESIIPESVGEIIYKAVCK